VLKQEEQELISCCEWIAYIRVCLQLNGKFHLRSSPLDRLYSLYGAPVQ